MAQIPSWLEPQNFIGAAEAGARLGLSRAEMLQQAEQHAAELALERDRLGAQQQEAAQGRAAQMAELKNRQNQQEAAMTLRMAALKQAGLLGEQRNENQAQDISARDALDSARQQSIDRKNQQDTGLSNVSRQSALQYKADNPNVSDAELMARFPMAFTLPSQIPKTPKSSVDEKQEVRQVLNPAYWHGGMTDVNTNVPAYMSLTNTTSALPNMPSAGTTPATPDETQTAGEALQPPTETSPPPITTTPRRFTDKTGTVYLYTGTADNPTTDTNEANWQVQPAGQ